MDDIQTQTGIGQTKLDHIKHKNTNWTKTTWIGQQNTKDRHRTVIQNKVKPDNVNWQNKTQTTIGQNSKQQLDKTTGSGQYRQHMGQDKKDRTKQQDRH